MIPVLFQVHGSWGLPSISADCLKAQAYMRFSGVTFAEATGSNNFSDAAELPILMDSDATLTGWGSIKKHLKKKHDLDRSLMPETQAIHFAFTTMIEKKLHDAMLYNWWFEDENFATVTRYVFTKGISFPISWYLLYKTRKAIIAKVSHMTRESSCNDVRECLAALSAFLGSDPYFGGDKPCMLDAIVFGHVAPMLFSPMRLSPLSLIVSEFENITRYITRILVNHFDNPALPQRVEPLLLPEDQKKLEEQQQQQQHAEKKKSSMSKRSRNFVALAAVATALFLLCTVDIEIETNAD